MSTRASSSTTTVGSSREARYGQDHARGSPPQLRAPWPKARSIWALKRLTLDLADGGAYALLGPSGCGKTTLLNLISGLLRPTEGRILFDGRDVTDKSPEERNIAQVFQFPVIYDTMTVYDNLAFPLRNRGVPEAEVDARVREIAAMLELEPTLKQARLGADRRRQAEDLARPRARSLRRQCHHVRRAADGHRSASEMGAALEAARSFTSASGGP